MDAVIAPALHAEQAYLEARGLVSKLSDPDDHRKMRLRLTSTGRTLTAEALQAFDEIWETKLCANLPDEEFARFMASGTIERSVAALRGRDCPLSLPHANRRFYSIDHVVYWRAMSDGWARVARRAGDVTMVEFGILALLLVAWMVGAPGKGKKNGKK